MQLDSNRLTRMERVRRLATGLCLYCGASGHFIQKCLSRPPRPAVSTLQVEPDISILPLLTVQLLTPHHSISVSALIDSGSSGNFISQNLLRRLDLPRKLRSSRLRLFKENRLGVGASSTDLHPSFSKLDAFTGKPFPFWYWRDPPSASSWDACGFHNIPP